MAIDNFKKKTLSVLFYLLVGLVLAASVIFLYPVWRKYLKVQDENLKVKKEYAAKEAECLQLNKEVNDIENEPKAVEKVAREKFGFCKENEVILKYKE
jgi:cell division protein FtsB